MLPDDSAGQGPGTLGRIESRRKEGMARFLASWYNFYKHYVCRDTKLISGTDLSKCNKCYKMSTGAVSRYKLTAKAGNGHGAEVVLRALVRSQG